VPGDRVVLADLEGPGSIGHIWMTFPPAPPEVMRGMVLEAFHGDSRFPSVSVPCLDFFGLPHGRPVPYSSMLTTAQEGRGFNSYVPIPFPGRIRLEVTNHSDRPLDFYYQVDYTLGPVDGAAGLLHVSFRRENPTTLRQDFVIGEVAGRGRFLGCVVGVRVIEPTGFWYGEGEVKVFLDGDGALPTICGTGLEDYVGSAWGLGAHAAPFAGTPLDVRADRALLPDFVGFYRWHVPDPIVFADGCRVTIQQIGFDPAVPSERRAASSVLAERVDDYCAAAFFYLTEARPVPAWDAATALADIHRRDYEKPLPLERLFVG
jgi:hypothetical protein